VNNYFVSLTDCFEALKHSEPTIQPVPPDLLVLLSEVQTSLSSLNTSTVVGLNMIPNRVVKEFAHELAPVIMDIYNWSLVEEYAPGLLKSSLVIHYLKSPRGGSRERVQGVCTPHPPPHEMTCSFLIQLVFCKKKTMWFIGVEVKQETSAPPPKKNPGSAPEVHVHCKNRFLKVFK